MGVVAGRLLVSLLVLGLFPPPTCRADGKPFTFTQVDLRLFDEAQLLDARLEKEGLVYAEAGVGEYLATVGTAVLHDRPPPERVTWRFRALRDPTPNAFALPNGSIYVHSGLLALLENEDQLASVLAHEATHVLARHSYLSNRSYRKKATASVIVGTMAGAGSYSVAGAVASVMASVTQVILASTVMGYSRELEGEADQQGFRSLATGGYDVTQMAATFRLLQSASALELESEPIFYNDHPKLAERIAYVTKLAAGAATSPPTVGADAERTRRFQVATERQARDSIQQAIDGRRFRTAVATARRLVDASPESTEMHYLLAEALRALGPRTAALSAGELESSGRKKAQSDRRKLTAAEEEKQLLLLPSGQAAWTNNQQASEAQYGIALTLDATNFKAHRGLGLLYEKGGRPREALAAYRRYLELALDPPDRARIERRIDAIEKATTPPVQD